MYPSAPEKEPSSHGFRIRLGRRAPRRLFAVLASFAVASLVGLYIYDHSAHSLSSVDDSSSHIRVNASHPAQLVEEAIPNAAHPAPLPEEVDRWHSSNYLRGPPTGRFRDNLRVEYDYITSWTSAGWTNDVITYINLLYLGLITNRIPILSVFTPSHVGGDAPSIPFGDIFDIPRLRQSINLPVLEWREVKNLEANEQEILGCWDTWESVQRNENNPRKSIIPHMLHLDISYTKAPEWIKLLPNFEHDQHTSFWSLATLAYPETRRASLVPPHPAPDSGVFLPPDEHLLCYDYLYYVCTHQPSDYEFDFSPVWRDVGQYLRWVPRLEQLGESYARTAMGIVDPKEPTPPWIAIHVRHRDFENWCNGVPVENCFAPLPVIARRVQEVQDELAQRKGIVVNHVIMTSDEVNATWWEDVVKLGWRRVDHTRTIQLYNKWYPLLIDAVIQSNGIGFVGNDLSTVSVVARRRVESWHDGVVRTVKWGTPTADDH